MDRFQRNWVVGWTSLVLTIGAIGCGDDMRQPPEPTPDATPDAALDATLDASVDGASEAEAGGPPGDPLDALLDTWFADYNAGQGVGYLDERGREFPDGDPEATRLPAHRFFQAVAYGPYSRNQLDFWMPEAASPTAVVVYIHGGGFISGERSGVRNGNTLRRFLMEGIAVATISYRWAYRSSEAALGASIPNDIGEVHDENGTRLDYILRDCARSIQYLRYRAEDWNIDEARIGAWGGSAGAGCTMWTASAPDLAQPGHEDPVLRESSRLTVAGHNNGQVTYAYLRWPELLGFDEEWVVGLVGDKQISTTQMSREDLAGSPEGQSLSEVLDYYGHLDASDPPFITVSGRDDTPMGEITGAGEIIHHVRGHYALYDRCQAVGMECAISTMARTAGFDGDIIAYLIAGLMDE